MSKYKVGDMVFDIGEVSIENIMEIKKITSDRLVVEGGNFGLIFI